MGKQKRQRGGKTIMGRNLWYENSKNSYPFWIQLKCTSLSETNCLENVKCSNKKVKVLAFSRREYWMHEVSSVENHLTTKYDITTLALSYN